VFYRAESYGFSPEFMELVKDVPVKLERATINGRTLLEGKIVRFGCRRSFLHLFKIRALSVVVRLDRAVRCAREG
jgi:hypothetical protein